MRKKLLFFLFGAFLLSGVEAQEPHFSQFYQNPVALNPALAGFNNCIMRVGGVYRDQWRSVSKPYRTYTFFSDARLQPYEWKHDAFGIGVSFIGDKAGSANMGTNDFRVLLAYHKGLGEQNKFIMSLGMSLGFVNHTLNDHALYFGNQWTGQTFSTYIGSNEPEIKTSAWYFDTHAGMLMTYYITDYTVMNLGIAVNHLNAPTYSFLGGDTRLGMKTTIHMGLNASVSKRTTIMPKVMLSMQNGTREIMMGFLAGYYPRLEPVYMGIYYRWNSDIIPVVGFQYFGFAVLASYDINISRFSLASKLQSGFEISLIKNLLCADPFFKPKSKISKDGKKLCPVF
jgi:type IX secretion system PorP/SprF family membrane protein